MFLPTCCVVFDCVSRYDLYLTMKVICESVNNRKLSAEPSILHKASSEWIH